MQLDRFLFSIATAAYEQLQQQSDSRWASIKLLGGGETLHYLGQNHDIITLAGTVYPQQSVQVGGMKSTLAINDLRDLQKDGLPLLLQDADGFSLGYWVILRLVNVNSNYLGSTPRIQQFRLTIKYYGETAE